MADREASPIPLEIRARLAELELELSEGDITQKGYEKKRSKLIRAYVPHAGDSSSGSEEEAGPGDDMSGMEHWMSRPSQLGPAHLGSTSSSSSSTQSGGSGNAGRLADSLAHTHISHLAHLAHTHLGQSHHQQSHLSQSHHGIGHLSLKRKGALSVAENGGSLRRSCEFGSDMLWPPPLESDENHSAPPDVTGYSSDSSHSHTERHHMANMGTIARNTQKYGNAERMETGDVQQPDPNQPRPEGAEMMPVRGEALGVVTNWPPSLEAALQRWGTISPKAPCLTSLDTAGKPLYVLTYGKLWSRSIKLAYNILHKLGSKQEPMVRPGDRVALVFPNNDPVAFMVAFYGCLLAEVVPVPIEVPLSRKDAGSQQIGFLLGSCGVTVALTSDACHKGLPKSATGEIPQFKGWPKLLWFVTESKHLSKPPRDWFPHIKDANNDTAYIESVMNMMHVISVPYSLMKVNPLSWIQKVCQYKGSISSCDAFLNVFQTKGLRVEDSSQPPGRGVLSMQGLSYGVVRVDTEERLSVLTVQDVYPVSSSGGLISDYAFVRTGLLSFIGPGGLVFITGKMDGLIMVSGRRHNADDIVATALAVEPMKFVYRGRIAVFSVTVLRDERIVVVAEQRPDSTEEDSFQWMSRVLQAIDSIHGVGVFCLALVPANTLPKTPLGGIHLSEIKQLYLEGGLHPCNVLMCPHTCVTNLPKPRQKQPGKRIAQASGRDLGQTDDNDQFLFLSEVLQWRAQTTPDHVLYTLLSSRGAVSSSLTCLQLHKRAERVAALLMERGGLQEGDHVALVYPPGIDLIAAFYGALYAGCVPITVRPPHPQNISTTLPTVKMIVEPTNPDGLAYLDFSVSTTGMLAGVQMSHNAVGAFCRSVKLQCELYPSREVAICLDPYCGLGFVLWCLCSVYSGHQSILIPPVELESNPALWLLAVSQLRVRDTFCSYSVMELCTKGLGLQTEALKARGLDLSRVRACVVVAEERPRMSLTHSFSKLFKDLGLHPRSVSTAFGCRVNLAICLQGTSGPDPTTVYVDMRALRHDRVRLVERGSPHSLPLMESGKLMSSLNSEEEKILPGVRIIIANPETKGPLGDSHLGEIWVHSAHNGSGYYSGYGEEVLQSDHFNSRLSFGDTQTVWARTGYLGFLRRTELTDANGERHDALFVVGALEEAMELRGMRYHPIDIETSVIRAHKSIMECAVFPWTNLLVVVVELEGSEQEALDLVPMVTKAVLEEHYLIVGVVVVTDIGVIPINSRGEKQRMHLRDGFLQDQLDPIYVAYNM
ncbi:hypothetical protein PAMP_010926 [Pampus punctatissimus]